MFLFSLYFLPLNFLFYIFFNAYFFVCSNFVNIFSSLVNLIRRHPNLHNPHRATYLCQFSSYYYHTSPRGPSITPSILPGATFLNDLHRKMKERINRTKGLSYQKDNVCCYLLLRERRIY